MSENIIDFSSYRKDIDKELEGWKGYKNDGTVVTTTQQNQSKYASGRCCKKQRTYRTFVVDC